MVEQTDIVDDWSDYLLKTQNSSQFYLIFISFVFGVLLSVWIDSLVRVT